MAKRPTITFVGGGNMARAICSGLLETGFAPDDLVVIDPSDAAQKQIRAIGLSKVQSSVTGVLDSDLVLLAVKPQIAPSVLGSLAGKLGGSSTVLSIVAGVSSQTLATMLELPDTRRIIRCMPNTPAMVGEGMTGLFAPSLVTAPARELAESIMASVGKTVWVQSESDLDVITAISGSGPAYFFLFMESLTASAIELGMSASTARQLAVQTGLGAAKLAGASEEDLAVLRQNVTSPGGTTEQAVLSLEANGLRAIVKGAVGAAKQRSVELSEEIS